MKRARRHEAWIQPSLFGRSFLACCSCGWAAKRTFRALAPTWAQAALHQSRIRGVKVDAR